MRNLISRATGAVLALALTAPFAWAQSAGTAAGSGGAAGLQAPGWSGYGPGPWMMGPRMMGGWGGGPMMGYGGYGGGGWMMMLLGAVVLVALLVFIFRALAWCGHPRHPDTHNIPHPGHFSRGLHALDERYARGEVNREEYLQKKQDITGG